MRALLEAAGIELIEIPAGRYLVGARDGTPCLAKPPNRTWDDYPLATPERWIDVARPFWISKALITDRQVRALDARHPGSADAAAIVSYTDATVLAKARGASVPTWWQWEIAIRGPEPFTYPWGNELVLSKLTLRSEWYASASQTMDQELVLIDGFGDYAKASSPFGLVDVAWIGVEWNVCDGESSDVMPSAGPIVRSACDTGAMAYMVPGARPKTYGDLRKVTNAFSGPIAACYAHEPIREYGRYLYPRAAFRLVTLG
jgi:hypothetical protein